MGPYTLEHFLSTLVQIRRMNRLGGILRYLPGVRFVRPQAAEPFDLNRDLARVQGIIHAMTPQERRAPGNTIDASRRRRIAAGSGVSARDVDDMVRQFERMAEMLRRTGRDSL